MNIYQTLALLTDADAELCLNGLMKGLVAEQPNYAELLASPKDMATVIQTVASESGKKFSTIGEVTPQERPKAIRLILATIAEDPALSPRLEAWFKTARSTLLEPVTSALVLAGIITALSTHVIIDYEVQNGKKKLKVKIEKKPTASRILGKFFAFFR